MRNVNSEEEDLSEKERYEEIIFELKQKNNELHNQITYLQEELSFVEDQRDKKVEQLQLQIDALEMQLGDALFNKK